MQQQKPDRSTRMLGAGLTMIAVVGLFALGGHWLDGKTGLTPLFLLVGFALGAVGGFLHLVNAVAPEMLPFRRRLARGDPDPKPDLDARHGPNESPSKDSD